MKEETQEEVKAQETPLVDYEFGDLYLKCSCGHEDQIAEGIENGIRFDILTTDKHNVKFGCRKCGTVLTLYFKEAAKIEELKATKAEKELKEQEIHKAVMTVVKDTPEEVEVVEDGTAV